MDSKERYIRAKLTNYYNTLCTLPRQIADIFIEFYGEDRVELNIVDAEEFMKFVREEVISYFTDNQTLQWSAEDWEQWKDHIINDLPTPLLKSILEKLNNSPTNRYFSRAVNDAYIIVAFPEVTVTNENGNSVNIKELWAKVPVGFDGTTIGFQLNRSRYSYNEWVSNYMHSHINGIPWGNLSSFLNPCLGSGPIRDTIASLSTRFDSDLWGLFCLELSKYVENESTIGGPYRYLEQIGSARPLYMMEQSFYHSAPIYNQYRANLANKIHYGEFLIGFLKEKKLKFNYMNGSYSIGMSYVDFVLTLSNSFITWYNKKFNDGEVTWDLSRLIDRDIIVEATMKNGRFYTMGRSSTPHAVPDETEGFVVKFKGVDYHVKVDPKEQSDDDGNVLHILSTSIIRTTVSQILLILNHRYGKEKYSADKEICYL